MFGQQFNDAEWRSIEAACGCTLSKSVRDNILQVTQEFLTLESVQTGNVANVKVVLESYDKATSRFLNAIFSDPSGQSAASIHAHDLVELNFNKVGEREESLFDGMLTTLRAFHVACNTALKQLRELETSSKRDKAWQVWIARLTEIIDQAGLPCSASDGLVSKDCFTGLVWPLQCCLPEQVRRHTTREAECAKEIKGAQALAKRGTIYGDQ